MRPDSMPGGSLHWIWKPYALYGTIDLTYGKMEDTGWAEAQSVMNLVEAGAQLWYFVLLARRSPAAWLVAFGVLLLTLSKTVLYFLIEHFSGWKNTSHNDAWTFWTLFVLPNGVWIVVPALCAWVLYARLAAALRQVVRKEKGA